MTSPRDSLLRSQLPILAKKLLKMLAMSLGLSTHLFLFEMEVIQLLLHLPTFIIDLIPDHNISMLYLFKEKY